MDYAVIMAGGTGKRLWPLSRKKRPKQVLKLLNGETLLRSCFDRLTPMFDMRNILVLTNTEYVDVVRENLPELPAGNVIAEPCVRDTAGAIGLAASVLDKYDPQATMAILTADQVIEPAEVLQNAVKDALNFINKNPENLITFGINPTFASTQLGYIKCSEQKIDSKDYRNEIFKAGDFKEKPDKTTAEKYLKNGNYLWNSGMFVWKAGTILEHIEKNLPEAAEQLEKIKRAWDSPNQKEVLQECFEILPKISIDFAVMEKAKNTYTIKLNCRWLDMGAFTALADFVETDDNNNVVVAGQTQLLDCKNSIVVTEDQGHLIAGIGLENVVVAHTADATLVCDVNHTQRLKELLEVIEKDGQDRFL
jgi:mannose-1-phosphate guanylyltransferase